MMAFARPRGKSDLSPLWFVVGAGLSVLLHALVVVWLWKPHSNPPVLPPTAVPMVVSVVGPVSSPKPQPDIGDIGPAQPELSASAPPPPVTEAEPEPESPAPIVAPKADKPSPIQATEEPPKPAEKPKAKPTPKPAKPEAKPNDTPPTEPTQESSQSEHSQQGQRAQSEQSVEGAPLSEQLTAPRQGQTSIQERQAKVSWQQVLHAHLERHKRYPRAARRAGKQGQPAVRFTMSRSGQVLSATLVSSSGTVSLDDEALALVQRASPLPKPPAAIAGDPLTLTVPINFSL